MAGGVFCAGGDNFAHGACEVGGRILVQVGGAQAVGAGEFARVGRDLAVEHFQQRRFAFAVAAVEADAFVALNAQADVGEDRWAAEGYGRVAEVYQGHCIKK